MENSDTNVDSQLPPEAEKLDQADNPVKNSEVEKNGDAEKQPVEDVHGGEQPADDNAKPIEKHNETVISESENNNIEAGKIEVDKPRGRKRKATENGTFDSAEQSENVDDFQVDPSLSTFSASEIMGKGKRARIPNKRYSDVVLSPNRKGRSGENSESDLSVKLKEESLDSTDSSSLNSPTLPKRAKNLSKDDIQDPKYLKPFKFGWRRELVWKSASNKKIGDIFYYTPQGKKVKSFREVADNLTNKNLTLDNFTFTKEALGLNDPQKETIRSAKSGKDEEDKKVEKSKKDKGPKVVGVETPIDTSKNEASASTSTGPGRRRAAAAGVAKMVEMEKAAVKERPERMSAVNANKSLSQNKWPAKRGRPPKRQRLSSNDDHLDDTPLATRQAKTRSSLSKVQSETPASKKRNFKLERITQTHSNSQSEERTDTKFMENFLQNVSFGYSTLLYVFQYLKVQDLLRAGQVCTMWRDISSNSILWKTVRMKNSQVHSFEGLANTLKKHGTVHLDLRKVLLPTNGDKLWPEFSRVIAKVNTLTKIELCRCPASVVEQLGSTNTDLEVINAVTLKCDKLDMSLFANFKNIRELRLRESTSGLNINSLDALKNLNTLKVLSLTSVNKLCKLDLSVIGELKNLECLDLGECTDFPESFGKDVLSQLEKLEKLRLEKGQNACHIQEILETVKNMRHLEQLELVNFDVKPGFDKWLGGCTNIKKLMIIPTYISQSATTNNMVLAAVLKLKENLTHFVWGVTLELLRVTELFVDQCEDSKETRKEKKTSGGGDSIPVLKPVPDLTNGLDVDDSDSPPQVEILPLPNLQKLLLNSLPTTRVKILKIPFHATWRQTLNDSV